MSSCPAQQRAERNESGKQANRGAEALRPSALVCLFAKQICSMFAAFQCSRKAVTVMKVDVLVAEIGSTTTVVNAFHGLDGGRPGYLGQGQAP